MIKAAFPLFGRGNWSGGLNYLKNTLQLLQSRLSSDIEGYVFLSPDSALKYSQELKPLVHDRIIVDDAVTKSEGSIAALCATINGKNRGLEALLMKYGIEVVFENANFYGQKFSIPTISWIPDFQHKHLSHMFSKAHYFRRELGFRAQIFSGRTILVSSQCANDDYRQFYPRTSNNAQIVRFALNIDFEQHLTASKNISNKYNLPANFLFLPNQFWKHKNHENIVTALTLLKQQGALGKTIPPIVLTGRNEDPRHPNHFDELMDSVNQGGVAPHFRYLGMIPYEDVLALNAACTALINPSLCEGWSTPIEESKALATPLLLSDIPIHREQAPSATFFNPTDPVSIAEALKKAAASKKRPTLTASQLKKQQGVRLEAHAQSLLNSITYAHQKHSKNCSKNSTK